VGNISIDAYIVGMTNGGEWAGIGDKGGGDLSVTKKPVLLKQNGESGFILGVSIN
jgi:hypothetical protein